MLNPLELPRTPDDPIRDAEDLARDLAYGAARGDWEPIFQCQYYGAGLQELGVLPRVDSPNLTHFDKKWGSGRPADVQLLIIFGLAEQYGESSYRLTNKAFDLLKQPTRTPEVFVSYRHQESSTFALLVEARLRLVGVHTVFVDKYIKGGEDWHGTLMSRVQNSDYLVCLIGKTSLTADSFVRRELEWARAAQRPRIIHVWHNGMRMQAGIPAELAFLSERQGHEVKEESAAEYEIAVNFILNALGYNTY